jgi:hypothetical protein
MKKPISILILLITLFSGNFKIHAQVIPNPYFEWFEGKSRSIPAAWQTQGIVSKGKGIRLANSINTDQYSTASLLKFDDSGLQTPAFRINGTPDSLKVSLESALDGDTAFIYFFAMKSGDSAPAVFQEIMIYGTHTSKTLSFALDYIHPDAGVVCDTAYLIIYSANPVNGPVGNGYINISGLQLLTGNTPLSAIPNHDFANWNETGITYPGDWTNHHMLAFNAGLNGSFISRSNDAHTGSYALWLKGFVHTEPNAKNDSFPAYSITTRSRNLSDLITPDLEQPSFSYSGRPQSFKGYVKTSLIKGDRLMAFVNLFNADTIVGSTVYILDSSISSYTLFEKDINWLPGYTGNCDKATIAFYITDSTGLKMVSPESQAWVDNIAFENFGVNTQTVDNTSNFSIYPNPAKQQTSIRLAGRQNISLYLLNTEGRILRHLKSLSDGDTISLSNLSAGIYFLISPETGITQKLIIQP